MAMVQHLPALKPVASPVCSICIANYNGLQVLGDCIESVLSQQGDTPLEIIVHDDASTDDSVAWIRQRYPQVELLASAENVGFCIANNRMVAQARGEFVLLLNNDAALYPDAIATLLDGIRKLPAPGILTLPQYDWQTGALVDRGCLLDFFYNPVPNMDEARREVAYVIGACLFLPRTLWNELGGFPEWFGSIAEDMYICCLARLRGLPVTATQASGYRHRQGRSFGGNRVGGGKLDTTYRRRHFSERNKTAVMVICTPTWLVWPMLVLHLAMLSVEGVLLMLLKRNRQVWRNIYGPTLRYGMCGLGSLRMYRQGAQQKRVVGLWAYLRSFTPMPRKFSLLWRHGLPGVR
ncbi:MAG TPA: glycosyltransferase [Rhodanobacteraceae bacterium]|nr:glycosyltransferase [Rhodanobacteraceae bacterium]